MEELGKLFLIQVLIDELSLMIEAYRKYFNEPQYWILKVFSISEYTNKYDEYLSLSYYNFDYI